MVINWRRDAGFWTFPCLPLIESIIIFINQHYVNVNHCEAELSARYIRGLVHDVWLTALSGRWIPSWCSLIRHWVNRSRAQQPDAAVCLWHFPLTFSVTLPWNSCCMAHTPLLWAKPVPLRPIFGRKLFFIAPKTLCLLPVWPRAPGASLRVVRPSFLLAVRGQL